MAQCPKCRGQMTQGFAYLPDMGSRVKWMDGEPGVWKALTGGWKALTGGRGAKPAELAARRCGKRPAEPRRAKTARHLPR